LDSQQEAHGQDYQNIRVEFAPLYLTHEEDYMPTLVFSFNCATRDYFLFVGCPSNRIFSKKNSITCGRLSITRIRTLVCICKCSDIELRGLSKKKAMSLSSCNVLEDPLDNFLVMLCESMN